MSTFNQPPEPEPVKKSTWVSEPPPPKAAGARQYANRYNAPYSLADSIQTLSVIVLIAGLLLGGGLLLYGFSDSDMDEKIARFFGALLLPVVLGFYGVLAIGVALLRAFLDQAVHSAPLTDEEKQDIVFKKRAPGDGW